ncbi:WD repeat-containing protein 7-like isoform X3 [Pomacea canaliculata]|uniref:WD repeat-containing protein 7-like isoform X3 n=1 Tax=Pomacea canaliculata TaxID=400727 RepID=UPI000D73567F|nr:WD repeat-containing protein 7-like isoform X3 [Pomacea canaliculata]
MSGGSSMVIPMVLWGTRAPTHCISAILMTPDTKNVITGCNDGQICIWDVADEWQIWPRSLLFGHTAAISCLAVGSSDPEHPYIVSSSENGEMCLWDTSDGRCIEHTKMSAIHSDITACCFRSSKELRLICNGYYPEILVMDPLSLEVVYSLCSKVVPDWISACCHIQPPQREDDVLLAISNSGAVKVWTLTGNESKSKAIYEDESKQIRCLNAQTLTCCPYNQRTVLIVCAKYWQVYNFEQQCGRTVQGIYDASDFTLLCSESNRCGERWAGGHFLSIDRVIVWSTDGRGYLYKLPTNLLRGRALQSANPDSVDYHRSHHSSSVHAYYILDFYNNQCQSCLPAITYFHGTKEQNAKLLIRGDSSGQVVIWQLPEVSEKQMTLVRQESFDRLPALMPKVCTGLEDIWNAYEKCSPKLLDGLLDEEKPQMITATIYIPSQSKLVCGRENGSVVIVPAVHCVLIQLLCAKNRPRKVFPVKVLEGHEGRVTALLYPFNECTRYEPHHLLSGGVDFSVILWDINSGCHIHTFTIHGGMVVQLLVPPANCNARILSSVCSVASDHSVALLSLKERKCIMLAGRHLFPVKTIRWRPLDDFMVVSCTDGTVYVWQMETGHLDRVVHGITAEEILNNCDENALPTENLTNPSLTLSQALKRRNFATFRNLAQQKLQQSVTQQSSAQGPRMELIKPTGFPLLLQGIRTNASDTNFHVMFFDTEALIVQLLTEEFATLSPADLEAHGLMMSAPERQAAIPSDINDAHQKLAGFIAKAKEKAENVGQKIQAKMDQASLQPVVTQPQQSVDPSLPSKSSLPQSNGVVPATVPSSQPENVLTQEPMTMDIAQLFMSCLHAWGLDPDLDRLCTSKLGLLKPSCPISFGMLSRDGHMSLMLPGKGWQRNILKIPARLNEKDDFQSSFVPTAVSAVNSDHKGLSSPNRQESQKVKKPTLLAQRMGSVPFDDVAYSTDDTDSDGDHRVTEDKVTQPEAEQRTSPGQHTQKTMSTISQTDAEDLAVKARWQISSAITTQHLLSVISVANTLMSMNRATFIRGQLPASKRNFSAADYRGVTSLEHEVDGGDDDDGAEAAAQSQIKQGWSLLAALHCVLLPELIGTEHYKAPQLEMLARRWQDRCLEIREAAQALLLAELRRIGAEGRKRVIDDWSPFLPTYVDPTLSILGETTKEEEEEEDDEDQMLGGDMPAKMSVTFDSRRRQATAIVMLGVIGAEFGQEIEPSRRRVQDTKKTKLKSQEGFSLSNYSLSRHTSKALTFLLLTPPSPKLPAYTPIRRAAIDLLGRGFTVWEPYLDISAVLMGLLELCVDADKIVPSVTFGLPLTPAADACRTARHALTLIATARPPAFIITLAKEVARYNAMAQNAQSQHAQMHNSVLVRASSEILHVIEMLVEKMPNDVADLIVEVMDVTMHCLDLNQLKTRGLQELFPAICRFSMVSYCPQTRRIWVGSKSGGLALYEMKQHAKCQMIQAHHGPVIAIAVSPDGKYLATFSHKDQKLKFFQAASSSLFGLGTQQTKCVRQFVTKEITTNSMTNILKLVRLVWVDNRTVVLLTVDGSETKYSV